MPFLLTPLARTAERWLHPWRRGRAVAHLRAHDGPGSILVVCQGNIYRSPFAAAILARRYASATRSVRSAGFIGPGRTVPPNAHTAARRWDVDLTAHRSQLVTPALLAQADLVVVMEPWQATRLRRDYGWPARDLLVLGDLDPGPVAGRAIDDPWDRPLAETVAVYERIVRCTEALQALLAPAPSRAAPVPAGGVAPPPRSGHAAGA